MPAEFGRPISPVIRLDARPAAVFQEVPYIAPPLGPSRRRHTGRWVVAIVAANLVAAAVYRAVATEDGASSDGNAAVVAPPTTLATTDISALLPERVQPAVVDPVDPVDTLAVAIEQAASTAPAGVPNEVAAEGEPANAPLPAATPEPGAVEAEVAAPDVLPAEAAPGPTVIEQPHFTVGLPGQPMVESFARSVDGVAVAATRWTVAAGDAILRVTALELSGDYSAETFRAAFDGEVDFERVASVGVVVHEEELAVAGGIGRDMVIDSAQGRIFTRVIAAGATIVAVTVISPQLSRPQMFVDAVSSLTLR